MLLKSSLWLCILQLTSSILKAQVWESPHVAQAHHIPCYCQNIFPFLHPRFPLFHFDLHVCVSSSVL